LTRREEKRREEKRRYTENHERRPRKRERERERRDTNVGWTRRRRQSGGDLAAGRANDSLNLLELHIRVSQKQMTSLRVFARVFMLAGMGQGTCSSEKKRKRQSRKTSRRRGCGESCAGSIGPISAGNVGRCMMEVGIAIGPRGIEI
jgi:hypothetical protein